MNSETIRTVNLKKSNERLVKAISILLFPILVLLIMFTKLEILVNKWRGKNV